jgi:nucleoside-diphosphate-sugar epimerase
MKLTIFAATGGIGRQALEQAVAAGHEVTAVVRDPKRLSRKVRAVTSDLLTSVPATLESAVRGADAVLSGLGASSVSEAGIASRGTREIVQAMKATGVKRIVVVSAAPVATVSELEVPNQRPIGARKLDHELRCRGIGCWLHVRWHRIQDWPSVLSASWTARAVSTRRGGFVLTLPRFSRAFYRPGDVSLF